MRGTWVPAARGALTAVSGAGSLGWGDPGRGVGLMGWPRRRAGRGGRSALGTLAGLGAGAWAGYPVKVGTLWNGERAAAG